MIYVLPVGVRPMAASVQTNPYERRLMGNWRKSTKSGDTNCLEIDEASRTGMVGIRNSKNPKSEVWVTTDNFRGFVAGIRNGDFD